MRRIAVVLIAGLLCSPHDGLAAETLEEILSKAQAGDVYCQAAAGEIYRRGEMGAAPDPHHALEWLKPAATNRHPLALYNLAVMYEQGQGLQVNPRRAASLYRQSLKGLHRLAESGDARALYNLGTLFKEGRIVDQNLPNAVAYIRKAADRDLAVAQHDLALLYLHGEGVEQDAETAATWCERAAGQGFTPAQTMLGEMYERGEGVAEDGARAAEWYTRAAQAGSAEARYGLGVLYYSGRGMTADPAEAAKWFQLAADQDHATSQFNLGAMYYAGKGVTQDRGKAVSLFQSAAEQGHAAAQYNLGLICLQGNTMDLGRDRGIAWLRKAAAQGHEQAARKLDELGLSRTTAATPETDEEPSRPPKAAGIPPLAIMGFHLGMNIDTACALLADRSSHTCRLKALPGRRGYIVPFDREHDLFVADSSQRVTRINFPGKVVDQLLRVGEMEIEEFAASFADSMGIAKWDEAPDGAAAAPSAINRRRWVYRSPLGEELILLNDRSLLLRKAAGP